MKIERFEDLVAWQQARKLAAMVYKLTNGPTFQGDRDLTRQMRRAAVSVMANIAEGFSRYSFKDSKVFFLSRSSLDPAIGPRPLAVGPSGLLQRAGGRDVAPIGAGVQVPRAVPVGLHSVTLHPLS